MGAEKSLSVHILQYRFWPCLWFFVLRDERPRSYCPLYPKGNVFPTQQRPEGAGSPIVFGSRCGRLLAKWMESATPDRLPKDALERTAQNRSALRKTRQYGAHSSSARQTRSLRRPLRWRKRPLSVEWLVVRFDFVARRRSKDVKRKCVMKSKSGSGRGYGVVISKHLTEIRCMC